MGVRLSGTYDTAQFSDTHDAPSGDGILGVFPFGFHSTGACAVDERFVQRMCAAMTPEEIEKHMPGMARAVRRAAGKGDDICRQLEVAGCIT